MRITLHYDQTTNTYDVPRRRTVNGVNLEKYNELICASKLYEYFDIPAGTKKIDVVLLKGKKKDEHGYNYALKKEDGRFGFINTMKLDNGEEVKLYDLAARIAKHYNYVRVEY